MSSLLQPVETSSAPPELRLLVELPPRGEVFWRNLRDLLLPRRLPDLELKSSPAPFWHDVFVHRGLPWFSFLESAAYHVVAVTIALAAAHYLELHPPPVARPTFDHSQVVYYTPSEYLPPLDTRTAPDPHPVKADPEFARQPIISVPREADNRSQTIVAPPQVRLKQNVALPNIVAWSDKAEKPRLVIPDVPVTPAAKISRIAPRMEAAVVTPPPDAGHLVRRQDPLALQTAVVAPPPDAAHLTRRQDQLALQSAVVAPPPDVQPTKAKTFAAPEPAVVAPPPALQNPPARTLGQINIGPSQVIAPAPQLPVAEQRALAGGRPTGISGVPQVVPPPPSVSGAGSAGPSAGSPGRVIALSLHPAVGAPPVPPEGNRRGSFAATPEGRAGATGSPGTSSGTAGTSGAAGTGAGAGSSTKGIGTSDVPAGLYVGKPASSAATSPVAGDPPPGRAPAAPAIVASASLPPPRVSSAPTRPAQSDNAAKLTEAERSVFGDRKFYSLTLNMPNLNSSGGSWVIRFAELKRDPRDPESELSQPTATRKVDPGYPLQLMRENVAGQVILYAVIHADGTVGDVRVLRSVDERLDRYATDALAQWKFEPATRNGTPIDVEATFKIPFKPARIGTNF